MTGSSISLLRGGNLRSHGEWLIAPLSFLAKPAQYQKISFEAKLRKSCRDYGCFTACENPTVMTAYYLMSVLSASVCVEGAEMCRAK